MGARRTAGDARPRLPAQGASGHPGLVDGLRRSDVAGHRVDCSGWAVSCLARHPGVRPAVSLAVLLAIFADDTAAYSAAAPGRHKLAPAISPGKTWEGFVFGTLAAILVVFVTLYEDREEFLTIGESLLLGVVGALVTPLGDLFESMLKRDLGVKDSGACWRVTVWACWTGSTRLRSSRPRTSQSTHSQRRRNAAPYTGRVKRVALLGATGSIGRQVLEIVAAHPSSSSSLPLPARIRGGWRRRHRSAAISPSCSSAPSRRRPQGQRRRRLRRPAGQPGRRGRRRPRAREQGEPRSPRASSRSPPRSGERPAASRRLEHSASLQCLEGRSPGSRHLLVLMPAALLAANPPTTWPTQPRVRRLLIRPGTWA